MLVRLSGEMMLNLLLGTRGQVILLSPTFPVRMHFDSSASLRNLLDAPLFSA